MRRLIWFVVACSLLAGRSSSGLTMRASVSYTGPDGGEHPIVGLQVHLRDARNDIVCSSTTDDDGRIAADHCSEGRSPYRMQFVFETVRFKVIDLARLTVSAITPSPQPAVGGVVDFSHRVFPGDLALPATLFGMGSEMVRAYRFRFGGWPRPSVAVVQVPAVTNGVPWTSNDTIHWPAGDLQTSALYHEFGHLVRHGLDTPTFDEFVNDALSWSYPQNHFSTKVSNEGFAFNEGWAEYFATLFDPEERRLVSEWFFPPQIVDDPLGLKGKTHFGPPGAAGGFLTEGNVAAALFQLEQVCGGYAQLFSVLERAKAELPNHDSTQPVHTMRQYLDALARAFPACVNAPVARELRAPRPQVRSAARPRDAAPRTASPSRRAPPAKPSPHAHAEAVHRQKARLQAAVHRLEQRLHARRATVDEPAARVAALVEAKEAGWALAATRAYLAELARPQPRPFSRDLGAAETALRSRLRAAFLQPHLAAAADVLRFAAQQRARANGPGRKQIDAVVVRYRSIERKLKNALASPAASLPPEAIPTALSLDAVARPGPTSSRRPPGGVPPRTPPEIVRTIGASCNKNPATGVTHFWSQNPNKDFGTFHVSCNSGFNDTMSVADGEFLSGEEPQPGHYRADGWYYHGSSASPAARAATSCSATFTGVDRNTGHRTGVRGRSPAVTCVVGTTE